MLEIQEISISFGGLLALNEVSLKVNEGEFVGLIGPNGSGKTTFFNVVTGVLKPESGKIIFKGKDITGLTPDKICKAGIARTFQIPRPFKSMSVLENAMAAILFCGKYLGCSRKEATQEARRYLELVDLKSAEEVMASELNLIGLRRLEIVRALATKPRYLLIDEAMSGLNREEILKACSMLRKIREEMNVTVIMVEHIMYALMNLVEKVIVFDYGQIIAQGEFSEITKNNRVIEAYLGKE